MNRSVSTKSIIKGNAVLRGINRAVVIYQPTEDGSDLLIVDINKIAESIEKVIKREIVGRKITDVFPGVRQYGIFDVIFKVWQSGNPEHIDMKEYNDERIIGWRENDVIKLDSGQVAAIYDDKTSQKQTELILRESIEKYFTIISTSIDGFIILDSNGNIIETNASFLAIVGFDREELVKKKIFDISRPKNHKDYLKIVKNLKTLGHTCFETRCICKDGKHIDVEVSANNAENGKWVFCFIRDITERKQKEADLFFIGYHDKLTGLYNRAFFMEEMKRLDNANQYPISIIIADINGLKIANDALGDECGDEILKQFAVTLNACLRKKCIAARWGGDEFIVLLPRTTKSIADKTCKQIKSMSGKVEIGSIKLSVELGCSTKEGSKKHLANIIKDAENTMYQNKLLNAKSSRSEIVSSLMKTMHEMNYETEAHEQRLLAIATQIGHKLDLMPQEIEEMRLLAILHDIGKIGVSKEIIMKPDRLTPEEWIEIKKHSEIGYRIAESTPGLAHISKYILSVHERWDGKGYPQGLKGNATPKLSRIIAIVDAYDTMVSGRPYKKPITPSEARKEIVRCSGTQFDPFLVELFIKLKIGK